MSQITTCLYSTVKNVSGGTLKFGFLPPHGRELEDDEEFTVMGDIVEAVIRGERVTSQRNLDALKRAIAEEKLYIVETPRPILYDDVTQVSKMLDIQNGSLGVDDPCWDSEEA